MNRRNFFGLLAGLAGALGLRAKAPVKLIEFDPPDPPLDPARPLGARDRPSPLACSPRPLDVCRG